MIIYKNSSAPTSDGEGSFLLLPHQEKFLSIRFDQNNIQEAKLLERTELNQLSAYTCHYIDIGANFNLLPKLSEEMVDDKALSEFMNWTPTNKVYRSFLPSHRAEIQFQTESVPSLTVSHAIPSVKKHHIIEHLLHIAQDNGMTTLQFSNKLFIAIMKEGKLVLCNSFDAKTDEEILYYILLVYQELNLSQEDFPITFYGALPEHPDQTLEYLKAYIRNADNKVFTAAETAYQGIIQLLLEHHENN